MKEFLSREDSGLDVRLQYPKTKTGKHQTTKHTII